MIGPTATGHADPAKQVSYAAFVDTVTGLPNRALFLDRVHQALLGARRAGRRSIVMLAQAGLPVEAFDAALRPIGERLRECLRDADTLARLEQDLFGVLLPALARPEAGALLAGRLLGALAEPVRIEGRTYRLHASIGIACCPDDAATPDALIERARGALQEAQSRETDRIAAAKPRASEEQSLPAFVEWSERYAVGVEVIDGQHRHLLALINRIGEDLRWGRDADRMVESLRELVRYTEHHFATEERLMDESGIGAERHRHEHRKLVENLMHFTVRLGPEGVSQSARFLQDWLFRHIDEIDRPFAAFLRARGIA